MYMYISTHVHVYPCTCKYMYMQIYCKHKDITIALLPCDAITAKAALASDKTSPETCCESLSLSASANKQPDSMIG